MGQDTTLKTKQLDFILEKLDKIGKISQKEKSFLDNFERISDSDFGEYSMLTNTEAENKIEYLINIGIEVICNICDELGPIGYRIIEINKSEDKYLLLERNYKFQLSDNCFYDLRYDLKKIRFYLESNNEYYELIPVNNN